MLRILHRNKHLEERFLSAPANVAYLYAAILFAAGFGFVIATMIVSNLIAPHKRTKEKFQPYESGEFPIGCACVQYPLGFSLFSLLFVPFYFIFFFILTFSIRFTQFT